MGMDHDQDRLGNLVHGRFPTKCNLAECTGNAPLESATTPANKDRLAQGDLPQQAAVRSV